MTLTGHLDHQTSPVGQYIRFVATIVDGARRPGPLEKELKNLLGLDTKPKLVVPPVAGANAGTVGTAFDYRVRYELGPCRSEQFVADLRRLRLPPDIAALVPLMDRFFADLDGFVARVQPWHGLLEPADELLLARYCVVLALLDSVYRIGQVKFDVTPAREAGLLALAREPAAEDVMNLRRSAAPMLRNLLVTSQAYVPNPTFAGSRDVGGADADFLLDDVLWDLKTTKNLDPGAIRDCLLQLVGYALLDYDDTYGIRRVCAYFARYDYLWAPPLWALIFPLARVARWLSQDREPEEAEIVERLSKVRGLMRRVSQGERIDYELEFGA